MTRSRSEVRTLSTIVVLAMHGSPPTDFPRQEAAEFFGLRGRVERAAPADKPALAARLAELDARMRAWPRTPENDPYHAGSMDLAARLRQATGLPVIVGFNEFCGPSLDQALDTAAVNEGRVLVITPMMTRGGEHAEREIPAAVASARQRHPGAVIDYLWPYDTSAVAAFLAARIAAGSSNPCAPASASAGPNSSRPGSSAPTLASIPQATPPAYPGIPVPR